MRSIAVFGLSLAGLVGCATYRNDLARGQRYYDQNQFDHALSVWRMLDHDWDSLDDADQSRYTYLRGMTDFRLGYRADARHWLAVSKAIAEKHPGGLDARSIAQLDRALTQLNDAVYHAGPPTSPGAAGRELSSVVPADPTPGSGTPHAAQVRSPAAAGAMAVAPAGSDAAIPLGTSVVPSPEPALGTK